MKCIIVYDVDTGEILHDHRIEQMLFELTEQEIKTMAYKKCAWIRMRYAKTNRSINVKVYETN